MFKKILFFFALSLLLTGCGDGGDDVNGRPVFVKDSKVSVVCDLMDETCFDKMKKTPIFKDDKKNQTLELNFFVESCRKISLEDMRLVGDELQVTVKSEGLKCDEGGIFVNLFVDFSSEKFKYSTVKSLKHVVASDGKIKDEDNEKFFKIYPEK